MKQQKKHKISFSSTNLRTSKFSTVNKCINYIMCNTGVKDTILQIHKLWQRNRKKEQQKRSTDLI